jgi:hypothetical protein
VQSGTAGQPVSLQSDFFTQGQPRSRQGKACHGRAEQSRAEESMVWLAWRAVMKDYFWKQSLLHEAPRACGEWLDLAPRPLLLLACFSFHRCSCSCSTLVFVCCCCCCCCDLWSHDSFLDRGAYLITNSHPATSNRPQADVLTAGRPITAALRPALQLGVMALKPFVSYWGSTLPRTAVGGNLTLGLGSRRPKKHQRHARRWSWTASCSASLTAAGMGCKRSALSSARECHSCESVQSLGREGGREENHGVCLRRLGV